MKFGICAPVEKSGELKAGGADFVEEHVQNLLQGMVDDAQWLGHARTREAALPILAANCLLPADLKIVGPHVDEGRVLEYVEQAFARAAKLGIKTIVFGSAGARNVPDGFDRAEAQRQISDFLEMIAPVLAQNDLTLVVEPLNKGESNIINTVLEAMRYVKDAEHPNIQCLVDSYHFWVDGDSLDDLADAMPSIRHVHVADKDGRVAPGESGKADYRPFFKVIKNAGYQGPICVEALGMKDYQTTTARVLSFLRQQWDEA